MTYFEVLGAELNAAAIRLHRRRRRRIAMASAATVLAVGAIVGGVALTRGDDTAYASVAVERDGGRVSIVLFSERTSGGEVLDELAEAGVRTMTISLRTGPSLDGIAVGMYTASGAAMTPDGDGYRLEIDASDTVVVRVGNHDGTGPYDAPSDAFAPGEPLECVGWPGQAAVELAEAAARSGVAVRFLDASGEETDELGGTVVVAAEAHSPSDVVAFVEEGSPAGEGCRR